MNEGRELVVKRTPVGYVAGWSGEIRGELVKSYGRFDSVDYRDREFKRVWDSAMTQADRMNFAEKWKYRMARKRRDVQYLR